MVGELRWILLGLSVMLLAGIWWWGARRPRQAPGNAELRETSAPAPRPRESRDWGVSPFEPLSIRTAGFEEVPLFDRPMTANPPPLASTPSMDSAGWDVAPKVLPPESRSPQVAVGSPASERASSETVASDAVASETVASDAVAGETVVSDSPAMEAPPPASAAEPAAQEPQRIITLRVCADGDVRWPGGDLLAVLEAHGLAYGRYKVFHRKHGDGRTLFCAASLVEPGTFEVATMPDEEFRGLTLFAVLPGPADSLETVDTMIVAALELADKLHGVVQDSKGALLTPQRAEALREDVRRFPTSLSMP